MNKKIEKKIKRKKRIRSNVSGTADKPRLTVFRSNLHIYAQLVDDKEGKTLFAYSDKNLTTKAPKVDLATEVGKELGKLAVKKGVKAAVFDRNGNKYHGRVKALANGAREAGLIF